MALNPLTSGVEVTQYFTSSLEIGDIGYSQLLSEEECNAGDPMIVSTTPGSNSGIGTQCFMYNSAGFISFNPNIISSPSDCTDTFWIYTAELDASSIDSPLPSNLQITVDSLNY